KSVVAKDITKFARRIEKLKSAEERLEMEIESRPGLERVKTLDESKHEEQEEYESEFLAESRPSLVRYRTGQSSPMSAGASNLTDQGSEDVDLPLSEATRVGDVDLPLPSALSADDLDLPLPTALTAVAVDEKPLTDLDDSVSLSQVCHNAKIRTNPNECKCNAHRWRRENFPSHKPLPSYESSPPEPLDAKLAAQLLNPPEWALDPTHIPQSGQPFIPERPPYPEPTTLRGYIRRQLETTRPVPREAYVRFGVMNEKDCEDGWGAEWRLQCQNDQREWDHERNVRRRWRRPSELQTEEYPVSELDGYEGRLLEHEMS
ncbi:hypothetical protein N0V95_006462, partial [Ascochyta clinopodiicola]